MKKKYPVSHLSETEKWLLVDLSNSNSKFALATPQQLLSQRRLPTASLTQDSLEELMIGWNVQRVIIASVVPKATDTLSQFFKKTKTPLLSIDAKANLGIKIHYPDPTSIGADRLANVVGATSLYATPCIVVDLGTAITFDIIDAQGAYIGGIIAPGMMTSATALHHHTALLPQATPSPIQCALGKNTLSAIHSGILLGARGLVKEVVERITFENFSQAPPTVIATGGDALLVAGNTNIFNTIAPTLTLEGLREVGCRTQ